MRRQIIFDSEARLEFDEAAAWYDDQQPGLGDRFEAEVQSIFRRIRENPARYQLVGQTVRQARLKIFKSYSIFFHVEPKFIGVVAVFHASRDPAELQRRLK
ncbi:MAG TPA: type II toxin-antitoxin system RelE/ParE family toxin [Candidatus Limnocylindria bacterium]|nr:type II toxin-antitoxin system RelE/ParE family toxin [Candidatus Limnocylindria bacterium]